MRRAAAKGDPSAAGQAAAAADRLREAQRQLHAATRPRAASATCKDAQRQAEEIAQEQKDIANDARQLPQAGPDRLPKAQMLGQRKDALEDKVADLEKQLDRMVGEQTRESRDTARKLTEAASGIRDNKIKEKIRYSKSLLGSGAPEQYARNFEEEIGANIDQLRKKLDEASATAGQQGRDQAAATRSTRRASSRAAWIRSAAACRSARQQNASRARTARCQGGPKAGQGCQAARKVSEGQQGQRRSSRVSTVKQGQQGQKGRPVSRARAASKGQKARAVSKARVGQGQGGSRAAGRPGRPRRRRRHDWAAARPAAGAAAIVAPVAYGYYFGPDDIRQFRGEARRWAQEGQALRNMLREQNVDPKEFDEIMKRLRELDSERVYQDVKELARLQTFVAEGMKRFEYALRRKVGDETDRALVSGSEEVPAEFKALVEEYYRSLSKGTKKQ